MIGPNSLARRYRRSGDHSTVVRLPPNAVTARSSTGTPSTGSGSSTGGNGGDGNNVIVPIIVDEITTVGVVSTTFAGGSLTLDVSLGLAFRVLVTGDVTSFSLTNFSQILGTRSERVTVYFVMDNAGNHKIGGWSSNIKWSDGLSPTVPQGANLISCLVFDTVDAGTTIFGNIIGLGYA